jgi:hypothetical protein
MLTPRLLFLDLSIHILHALNLKKTKKSQQTAQFKKSATLINNILCETVSSHAGFYENYFLRCNAVLWQTDTKVNGITFKYSNFQHYGNSSYSV